MRHLLRAVAVSSFLVALAVAGLCAYPSLADEAMALTYVMDDHARLTAANESIARIDRETELVQQRVAIKQEAVRDLLDGRMTFDDAARRFAEVNRMHASSLTFVRNRYPGESDEERAGWQLAGYLRLLEDPRARFLADQWECDRLARS